MIGHSLFHFQSVSYLPGCYRCGPIGTVTFGTSVRPGRPVIHSVSGETKVWRGVSGQSPNTSVTVSPARPSVPVPHADHSLHRLARGLPVCQGHAEHVQFHSDSAVAPDLKNETFPQGAVTVVRKPTHASNYSGRMSTVEQVRGTPLGPLRQASWRRQHGKEPERTSPAEGTHQPGKSFLHSEQLQ